MEARIGERRIGLAYQLGHESWRIEGRRGLEDDLRPSVLVRRCDIVGQLLVVTTVPLVAFDMTEKESVELLDVVFGQADITMALENERVQLAVSANLGFVARAERIDPQTAE